MHWLEEILTRAGMALGLVKKEKTYLDHWFEIDERIRFVLTGGANMGIRYIVFVILVWVFHKIHYQWLLALTWLLSTVWAYFTYKYLVFQTAGNHWREYFKSVAVWSLSYLINAGILELFTGIGQINVYFAQAAAIVIITIVNYLLFKHFAFRSSPKPLSLWEKMLQFFDVLKK